jgi:hypothetical protein
VPEYRDQNDRDVAGLLETFDELVRRAEAYRDSLQRQLAEATAAGESMSPRHIERGSRQAGALVDLLEDTVLEALIDIRNNQHHVHMSRAGKLV